MMSNTGYSDAKFSSIGRIGVGSLFVRYVAVRRHSPQNERGKFAWKRKALATSRRTYELYPIFVFQFPDHLQMERIFDGLSFGAKERGFGADSLRKYEDSETKIYLPQNFFFSFSSTSSFSLFTINFLGSQFLMRRSKSLGEFIPEIERYLHKKKREAQNNIAMAERTLKEYATPSTEEPQAIIMYPTVEGNNFEIKSALLNLVQQNQFSGSPTEDPNLHISSFIRLSGTIKENQEAVRLHLFPFSLREVHKFRQSRL
ncbi:hypothetical protein MTR_0060s0110 [Medicago truncatula]|uniref:Uncharacterized protein n=1 Tax=Medicago truncatula TaxID=3880 RepID=A0A072TIC4_MEDTR|nr:hypothetical protein MTR_0060s0110 [Medicago truncatula]